MQELSQTFVSDRGARPTLTTPMNSAGRYPLVLPIKLPTTECAADTPCKIIVQEIKKEIDLGMTAGMTVRNTL